MGAIVSVIVVGVVLVVAVCDAPVAAPVVPERVARRCFSGDDVGRPIAVLAGSIDVLCFSRRVSADLEARRRYVTRSLVAVLHLPNLRRSSVRRLQLGVCVRTVHIWATCERCRLSLVGLCVIDVANVSGGVCRMLGLAPVRVLGLLGASLVPCRSPQPRVLVLAAFVGRRLCDSVCMSMVK